MSNPLFIREALFVRATPTGETTYHIVLAREVEAIGGGIKIETTDTLTPAQATELGFSLSEIVTALNNAAIGQAAIVTQMGADLVDMRELLGTANASLTETRTKLEAANARIAELSEPPAPDNSEEAPSTPAET